MNPVRPGAHAFADESRRRDAYVVAAVVLDPQNVAVARKLARSLLMPNQHEIHFSKEKPKRRREILSGFAQLRGSVRIYQSTVCGSEEDARQHCLRRLAEDLRARGAGRLVLDSRDVRDRRDERTFRSVLGRNIDGVRYDHVDSTTEPVLWIADAVAWSYGAAGDWRRRAESLISEVVVPEC